MFIEVPLCEIVGYPITGWDVLFFLLCLAVLIQFAFHWLVYARVLFTKSRTAQTSTTDMQPISVVIAARNEQENLKRFLPLVLEQDYPEFEVIVVNNNSDDESALILKALQNDYAHLQHVEMNQELNFFTGKKFPLSIGIKSAKHDRMLFIDADCKPEGNQWLKLMAAGFSNSNKIVLGYGKYEPKKGLLNKIIRFDTFMVGLRYLGLAKAGLPYMGVGRNLAYTKTLFYEVKGFTTHYNISSGDDDLFVNRVATANNCTVQIAAGSRTISTPKQSFSAYCTQKRRHFSTAQIYKKKHIFLLGIIEVSQWMVYFFTALLLCFAPHLWWLSLLPFMLRFISQMILFFFSMRKLEEKKLLLFSPFIEIITMFLHPFLLLSRKKAQGQWK